MGDFVLGWGTQKRALFVTFELGWGTQKRALFVSHYACIHALHAVYRKAGARYVLYSITNANSAINRVSAYIGYMFFFLWA